jgi:hypothetical protein
MNLQFENGLSHQQIIAYPIGCLKQIKKYNENVSQKYSLQWFTISRVKKINQTRFLST